MASKFHESNTNIKVKYFIRGRADNCKSNFLWATGKPMHYLEEWRQFLISANYLGVFFVDEDYLSAMK